MAVPAPAKQGQPTTQETTIAPEKRTIQQALPQEKEKRVRHAEQEKPTRPARLVSQVSQVSTQRGQQRDYSNETRRDFSRAHRSAYFLVCILSIGVLGCALGLACAQATYHRGWEYALYVGGTQRTAQWAISNTTILSDTDQIAIAAWSGVASIYFVVAVVLLYMGRYNSRLLRSGVDIVMLLVIGLAGCAILAWTMAYKWSAYAYCHRTFKLEALAICNLAIATIILGWILSGLCLIGAFLEALAISRHEMGLKSLRVSFHRLEAPRRRLQDFSRLTGPRSVTQAQSSSQYRRSRSMDLPDTIEEEEDAPTAEKLAALEKGRLMPPQASRSGSEASTKSTKGSSEGEFAVVNTLQWGAPVAHPVAEVGEVPNALSGEEVLVSPHEGPVMIYPPEYFAPVAPNIDAQPTAVRPGRVPVDRASGYVPDGQAGRGVRSPTPGLVRSPTPDRSVRTPTYFVQDHYTRPVTPPTRRASHQRSLSQANEVAAALRLSRAESAHSRSKSWDYI